MPVTWSAISVRACRVHLSVPGVHHVSVPTSSAAGTVVTANSKPLIALTSTASSVISIVETITISIFLSTCTQHVHIFLIIQYTFLCTQLFHSLSADD